MPYLSILNVLEYYRKFPASEVLYWYRKLSFLLSTFPHVSEACASHPVSLSIVEGRVCLKCQYNDLLFVVSIINTVINLTGVDFLQKCFLQLIWNRAVTEVVQIKCVVRLIFRLMRILKYREESMVRSPNGLTSDPACKLEVLGRSELLVAFRQPLSWAKRKPTI